VTFGAVWCAEHQKKLKSPDGRTPSGEIFSSSNTPTFTGQRLRMGISEFGLMRSSLDAG
jgi:hypothetical protein